MMNLSSFIARRYLFAKKSHNVINIISLIAAAGIAVGSAALVIILSIYNGFDSIVRELNNSYTADILITPSEGKVFDISGLDLQKLKSDSRIKAVCPVLEENVFVQYGDAHTVAVAKGVDEEYEQTTGLRNYVAEGDLGLHYGEIGQVAVGSVIASRLGLKTAFLTPVQVFFPSRTQDVDLLNPMSSLRREKLYPSGIISLDQEFDQKYMIMPLEKLRSLLEYEEEVSSVEIYLSPEGLNSKNIASKESCRFVSEVTGGKFVIRDKQQQNEMLYKLLSYEKIAIYFILLFVMVIISFNIFGSLSMLIIEKQDDISVLRSMGADDRLVKKIFVKEGWLISIAGLAAGIVSGLVVCLIQQQFGIVKMPGNFVISAYPVVIQWTDVLAVAVGVGLIGYLVSIMTKGRFLK